MSNTSTFYWNCNCKTNYIHPSETDECSRCGALKLEQPNTPINELPIDYIDHLIRIKNEAIVSLIDVITILGNSRNFIKQDERVHNSQAYEILNHGLEAACEAFENAYIEGDLEEITFAMDETYSQIEAVKEILDKDNVFSEKINDYISSILEDLNMFRGCIEESAKDLESVAYSRR